MSEIDNIENQLILRVPDEVADELHKMFESTDPNAQDFVGSNDSLIIPFS